MGVQARYQVRFDWGTGDASAIAADTDVVVQVHAVLEPLPPDLMPIVRGAVLRSDFRTAVATACWILDLQNTIAVRARFEVEGGQLPVG